MQRERTTAEPEIREPTKRIDSGAHSRMSQEPAARVSRVKTASFIVVAVLSNSFGNLLLSIGMDRMPDFARTSLPHYILMLAMNPFVIPGAALSLVYLIAQLSLFSWADLSYVVPLIASSYVVTTLLSEFILREPVELKRWMGVLLISGGVALVMKTPPHTVAKPEGQNPC